MARQVLFVQGAGEDVHDRWDSKLVASLERELGESYSVRYPRMPNEADPRFSAWKAALAMECAALKDGAILVGHSFGGTVLIHAIAELRPKPRFGGLFVVAAPFIGEGGWPTEDFDDCEALSEHLLPDIPVYLYHGTADQEVPVAHVDLYAKTIPRAVVRTFENKDHQFNNDMSDVARDIRSLG